MMMYHFVTVGFKTSFHNRGSIVSYLSNFEQNYLLDIYLSMLDGMYVTKSISTGLYPNLDLWTANKLQLQLQCSLTCASMGRAEIPWLKNIPETGKGAH